MPSVITLLEKYCSTCNKKLVLRNNRDVVRKNFCSKKCKVDFQKNKRAIPVFKEDRICEKCESHYIANHHKQQYCSRKCWARVSSIRVMKKHNDLPSHLKRLLIYPGREKINLDMLLDLYKFQGGRCALSGIKMTWETLSGRVPTNVSIDRIDSKSDYNISNVQLVCAIINRMKQEVSQHEFVDLCRKIVEESNSKCIRQAA